MSNQKHLTGWYESENGTVFHALTEGGMSQETLEAMGKMADVACKLWSRLSGGGEGEHPQEP